jgi:hypothetical protein
MSKGAKREGLSAGTRVITERSHKERSGRNWACCLRCRMAKAKNVQGEEKQSEGGNPSYKGNLRFVMSDSRGSTMRQRTITLRPTTAPRA